MMFASRDSCVWTANQDLSSDGHDIAAMAITKSDRIRWSLRREIYSER